MQRNNMNSVFGDVDLVEPQIYLWRHIFTHIFSHNLPAMATYLPPKHKRICRNSTSFNRHTNIYHRCNLAVIKPSIPKVRRHGTVSFRVVYRPSDTGCCPPRSRDSDQLIIYRSKANFTLGFFRKKSIAFPLSFEIKSNTKRLHNGFSIGLPMPMVRSILE